MPHVSHLLGRVALLAMLLTTTDVPAQTFAYAQPPRQRTTPVAPVSLKEALLDV